MDLLDQTPIIATQVLPGSPDLTPPPPTPKKSRLFPILAAILTAILLGATSLFSFKYFTLKSQPTINPDVTPIPTLTPSLSDWDTFTDKNLGISFTHPSDIKQQLTTEQVSIYKWGPSQKEATEFYDGINLSFSKKPLLNRQIKDIVDKEIELSKSSQGIEINIIKNIEPIIINGISGYTFTENGMGVWKRIFLPAPNNKDYIEIVDGTVDPTNQGFEAIVSRILSTFKFIDNTNSEVIINSPQAGAVIESPVTVKGTAPKGWTFESILSISIEDDQHVLLSGGPVSTEEIADSDNLVSFDTVINFASTTDTGYITIKNDNPSGLPENDKSFSLPIKFAP